MKFEYIIAFTSKESFEGNCWVKSRYKIKLFKINFKYNEIPHMQLSYSDG